MTHFDRICDGWHDVAAEAWLPLLASATPDPETRSGLLKDSATAFLVAILLLGLFFIILFIIAVQRRQRRSAERKRREAPLADAWAVAGQRAEPYGGDSPAQQPAPSAGDESYDDDDDEYGDDEDWRDDDDDDVVPH